MSYKLEKPYTDTQRADFVCEHQGLTPVETGNAFYMLEANELFENDEVIINPNYDAEQAEIVKQANIEKIKAEIANLDLRSIRALREGGSYNESQTYLEHYTEQITALREQISSL